MSTGFEDPPSPSASSEHGRPQRKSEPPPAGRRLLESWEYPMSKEEKKDRVIFLFEQELNEARQNEEQTQDALDELVNNLDRLEELRPGTAKRLQEAMLSGAARRGSFWPIAISVLVLVLAVVLHFAGREPFRAPGAEMPAVPTGPDAPAAPAPVAPPAAPPVAPAAPATENATPAVTPSMDMQQVRHLRRMAQDYLRRSDCAMAAHFLGRAQELLHSQANLTDVALANETLLGERGFALICSQRFREGAALLQSCLGGGRRCSSHLLNALGYAFWKQQEFRRATESFQISLEAEQTNPIIWNNLAAALMELGEWQAADLALDRAAQLSENRDEKARAVTIETTLELKHRMDHGEVKRQPRVEIWFDHTSAEL